jgi:hypothetical protein
MGIVNRRNAMIGWTAWKIGKRVLKRKAKETVPVIEPEPRHTGRKIAAVLGVAAATAAAITFWKKTRNDDDAGFSGD